MKLKIRISLAILGALWLTSPVYSQTEDPIAMQHEVRLLWASGDYARAIEAGKELSIRHADHRRGQTAYFHSANFLENQAMSESQTLAEARKILESAQWYFEKSAEQISDPKDELRVRSLERLDGVVSKLAFFDRIAEPRADYVEVSSMLAGLEASGVAAAYLVEQLPKHPEKEAHILFLYLTYQMQYVDQLNQRLQEAYKVLRDDRPELFEYNYNKYTPLLNAATDMALKASEKAISTYPESDHLLDYHVHRGDAFSYRSDIYLTRRDKYLAEGEFKAAEHQLNSVLEHLKASKAENLAIIGHVNRMERSGSSMDPNQLAKHKELAEERIAMVEEVIARIEVARRASQGSSQ